MGGIVEDRVSRVLLVDDQVLYREALRGLIDRWDEFDVVGEASDGEEAVELALSLDLDLVLMDVKMPSMDGITATRVIMTRKPDLPIVMLTVESEKNLVFEAIQMGARGYLLKDTPARKLRDRLRAVLQGEATLSESVAGSVLDEFSRMKMSASKSGDDNEVDRSVGADFLTRRDKDILHLLSQGKTNEEIAAESYLSLGTVKKRISQIMVSLGLENRVQLAVYAVKAGFDK